MSSCGATSDFSCLGSVQAGVRIRETRKIDLLEGKKPNRGWLGPEMSGEEVSAATAEESTAEESTAVAGSMPIHRWRSSATQGATFPEKLWWAIDEAKARLDTEILGQLYDAEALDIDEGNKIQLVLFACMAKDEADILPGDPPSLGVERAMSSHAHAHV